MQKLGLLGLCALVFSGLFYALLQTTPTSGPAVLPPPAQESPRDIEQVSAAVTLKLDRSLGQIPDGPAVSPPASSSTLPDPSFSAGSGFLTDPSARDWTQLAILVAAVLLGLFASRALRGQPAPEVTSGDFRDVRPPESVGDEPRDGEFDREALANTRSRLLEAQQLLDSGASEHAEEVAALHAQLGSRDVELDEARERLTMLEQTIVELRDDLKHTEQRYEALGETRQEELDRLENQKRASQQAHTDDVEAYEETVRGLSADLDETRSRLDTAESSLDEHRRHLHDEVSAKKTLQAELDAARADLVAGGEIIAELENARVELTEVIAGLEERAALADTRKTQLDELEKRYAEASEGNDRLVAGFEQLQREFERVDRRAGEADELESELKQLKNDLESEIRQLKDDLEKASTARDETFAELGEMHTLFNQAQVRAAQADELEDDVAQITLDLQAVARARDAAEEQVETLRNERESLRRELDDKDRQLTAVEERANTAAADLDTRRRELEETQAMLAGLREELADEKARLETLQREYEELVQRERELDGRLEEQNSAREALEKDNASLTESVDTGQQALSSLQQQHEALQDAEHKLLAELQDERQRGESLQSELLAANESTGEKQRSLDSLQTEHEALLAKEQKLRTELQDERQRGESLQSDLLAASESAGEKQRSLDSLQTEHEALLAKEQELRAELDEQQDQNDSLRTENSALTESVELLREDLAGMVVSIGEKNDQIISWQEQLADEKRQVIAHQAEIEGLLQSLEDENEKVAALTNELAVIDEMEQRLSAWDNSLQTYRGDIDSKNKLIDQLRDAARESGERASRAEQQAETVEHRLKVFEGLQAELHEAREAQSELEKLLDEQQVHIDELIALGQLQDEKLDEQTQSLEGLQEEREHWHQQLELKANTVRELEAELLDQHDTLLSMETLIDGGLAQPVAGVESHQPASDAEAQADQDATQALPPVLQKGHALVDVLQRTDAAHAELVLQTTELRDELEKAKARTQELTATAERQTNEFAEQQQELQNQLDAAGSEHDLLTEQLEELRDARDSLTSLAEERAAELEQAQREHDLRIEELERARTEDVEKAGKEHDALTAELSELQKTYSDQTATLKELQQEHEVQAELLDEQHQEHQAALGRLDSDLEAANQSLATQADELSELQKALDATREEHASAVSELTVTREHRITAESALADAQAALHEVEQELAANQASLGQERNAREQDGAAMRALNDERDALERELDEARRNLGNAEQQAAALRQEHDEALASLHDLREQSVATEQSLHASLAEQQKVNRQLSAELAVLTSRLEQVTAVPVLTQKVAEGSLASKSPTSDIPVLGQPVSKPSAAEDADIPVLRQPVKPGKS